ncbi:MalT transcriptional regulator family protein [Deinococcus aquaedulcis]|uniref:LuxR family transcriptional regulator n=1 Tax=Deinococcus aquaedulcis TaxID=2840455 RepID=UPI001C82BE31|nr:LuxR family transcriptional regulator [Deinococcus aquaedulcis]
MPPASPPLHARAAIPKALPHEVVRQAALERLSQVHTPCTVLLAASGYGKSTLLAQYARSTRRRVAWLTASTGDCEVQQLMQSLNRAFAGRSSVEVPAAYCASLDGFAQELVRQWGQEDLLDLIIDHAERISGLHGAFLASVVDMMPEGHRLILAGYDLHGFPLARLSAAGQVDVLTQAQLRFSPEETARYMEARDCPELAAPLQQATDGWPVGLALGVLDPGRHVDADDLLRDVLATLPPPIQVALPDLALLEEWNEASPGGLGVAMPDHWLVTVRGAGLPLTPLGRGLYRPHGLLLGLLRRQLERDPARARTRYTQAAQQAMRAGDLLSAARFAALAGDETLLEHAAARLFPTLRSNLEFALLTETTALHPGTPPLWWQEYAAIARIETGEVAAGLQDLHALQRAGQLGALGYAALSLQAARAGDLDAQLRYAEEGLNHPDAHLHPHLNLQKASALISLGRLEEGLSVTGHLVAEARRRAAPLDEANSLNYHQYALQMLRRWDEQETALERARTLFHDNGRPASALQIDTKRIDTQLLQGRLEEAEALLRQSLAQAERSQPVHLPALYQSRARLLMARGQWPEAAQALQAAQQVVERQGLHVMRPFLHFNTFDLYAAQGETALAEAHYQQGLDTATLPMFRERLTPLYTGLRAFDQGDDVAARRALTHMAESGVDRAHVLRAHLLLLALDARAGRLNPAQLEALVPALRGVDLQVLCAADQVRLRPLMARLGTQNAHFLRGMEQVPVLPQQPTFELHVGRYIECRLEGRVLKLPLAKSGELLVWLLWHGSGTLNELRSDLWDGSRDPRHHEYFRVVVRRLRALFREAAPLEVDPLPYLHGRYQLHPDLPITCNLLEAREQARNGQCRALLILRPQDLLSDVDADWAQQIRDTLSQEQVQTLGTVESTVAQQDPAQAIAVLREAVRVHHDQEAFHLSLIRVLTRWQPDQAPAAYQAYAQMLDQQFGTAPDPTLRRELQDLGLRV